jgi:hypothetical protein
MDRPRLRPLEAFPIEERGQKLLALRDPSGLAEGLARLPPLAVAVVQLFDGESTRDEIVAEFQRRYQRPLERKTLDQLIQQLDDALLLDSEKFRQHSAKVFADFARSEVRPAALAGRSYPSDPAELSKYLDDFFAPPHGPGAPSTTPSGPLPRAIVAPHVDFHRGGPAYAWAYKGLAESAETPDLIVVFGTDHIGSERAFALTKKHYETPLGRMQTDTALVADLASAVRERLGAPSADGLFYDEHHHRGEHSIEFQMVWLRKVLGARADGVKVLPILTGSLRHLIDDGRDPSTDSEVSVVLSELRRLVANRTVLWIAGADLAHVGPRYGDPEPLDRDDLGSLERRDQQTLARVVAGDAKGWFDEIAREKDRRNVCGLSPIYALLATTDLAATPGKLLAYAQCPADERNTSVVSIASIVF